MTPDQAKFLADIFLPMAQKESATTRRVLKAVPVGKDGYRPHPDSRSALELAWHIASSEVWFLDGFLTGQFEMEDDSMPGDIGNTDDIAALYEDGFESKFPKVAKISSRMSGPRRSPSSASTIIPWSLYLQFMLHHSIHHRGQLCAYLRQMGGKVPNIYGGSFDEPMTPPSEE